MRVPSSIVELRGITKRFPGVIACDRVDLQVYPGKIHALLGENGAGKTTLMHILFGLHQPDAGEIWIDGERMVMRSPKNAIRAGIGMVFQHFTLIPSLTVAENIALAATHSHVFMRRKPLTTRVQELAAHYRLPVDPNSPVWQLSVGEQQRVEILKLLHRRPRLLILDEPSAVLTPHESEAANSLLDIGADVIATQSDSPAPVQTAERRGAYGVGYNSDASKFAPEKHLTSAVWNWGLYYVEAVKHVRAGTWQSTDDWWPIGTGIVGLSPLGPAVSEAIKNLVEQRKQDLMAGRFDVFWGPINDQSGKMRIAAGEKPPASALLSMDWLVEGVIGTVPK